MNWDQKTKRRKHAAHTRGTFLCCGTTRSSNSGCIATSVHQNQKPELLVNVSLETSFTLSMCWNTEIVLVFLVKWARTTLCQIQIIFIRRWLFFVKPPICVGNRPISFCEFSGIQACFSSSCRETKFRWVITFMWLGEGSSSLQIQCRAWTHFSRHSFFDYQCLISYCWWNDEAVRDFLFLKRMIIVAT